MKGELIQYHDHRLWCLNVRKHYYENWTKLFKWNDGKWKCGLVIGKYCDKVIIELDEGEIHTIDKELMYPYQEGYDGKRWKKKNDLGMYIIIVY